MVCCANLIATNYQFFPQSINKMDSNEVFAGVMFYVILFVVLGSVQALFGFLSVSIPYAINCMCMHYAPLFS